MLLTQRQPSKADAFNDLQKLKLVTSQQEAMFWEEDGHIPSQTYDQGDQTNHTGQVRSTTTPKGGLSERRHLFKKPDFKDTYLKKLPKAISNLRQ